MLPATSEDDKSLFEEEIDLHCILEIEMISTAQNGVVQYIGYSFRQQCGILQRVEKHQQPSCRASKNIWMCDVSIKGAP